MKLTVEDQELLYQCGYEQDDFQEIENGAQKTVCKLNGRRIPQKKALELLGREDYISGLARSVFHLSALRRLKDGSEIYFDSRPLFR